MTASSLRRLTVALALAWLALGYANLARGLAHTGPRYRIWSFQNFCYSDVIALHGDRYLGGSRPLPYLEDRIEYPVLLGLALWLPSYAPGGAAGHFTVTYLFLSLCLLAALLALDRTPGASAWWLGATPALVVYAGLNWDLLVLALMAAAALALSRARPGSAGTLVGLGVSAKLFPGVWVLPALGGMAGARATRRAAWFAAALALALVAVNLPVALEAPSGWAWFFVFNAGRGAENSLWHALGLGRGPLLEALSTGPVVLASAFAAWAAARAAAEDGREARAVRLGAALALSVWIATNKVWSPQYALYGFFAGALVSAPRALFGVLTVASLVDYWAAFQVRALHCDPSGQRACSPVAASFRDHVFHPSSIVRSLLWLALAAWIARELWREARGTKQAAPARA